MDPELEGVFCSLRVEDELLTELAAMESMEELLRERRARVRTRGALLSDASVIMAFSESY